MITRYLKYQISESNIEAYEKHLARFLDKVKRYEAQTIYKVYRVKQRKDTYVHVVTFKSEMEVSKHRQAEYTKLFSAFLQEVCLGEPDSGELISMDDE